MQFSLSNKHFLCFRFACKPKGWYSYLSILSQDAMESNGLLRKSQAMYDRALHRICTEEVGFDIDTLPPHDIWELSRVSGQPVHHKNYALLCKRPLDFAAPQADFECEMIKGNLYDFGAVDDVEGDYHGWAPLSWLVARDEVMEPCRTVINLLNLQLASENHRLLTTPSANLVSARVCSTGRGNSSSSSSSSGNPVAAQVGSKIQYAENFQTLPLRDPIEKNPFDKIRSHIGRLTRVREVPVGKELNSSLNREVYELFHLRIFFEVFYSYYFLYSCVLNFCVSREKLLV